MMESTPTEIRFKQTTKEDPHAATWEEMGSGGRSEEAILEGRRHVAKTVSGGRILATIPQGGRRGQRPSRAGALSERTTQPPIGTRRQPLVSSLAADDSVNDAPTPLPRSRLSSRICDQP